MTPIGRTLCREAARFYDLPGLLGKRQETVLARMAVAVVLRRYGWSHERISRAIGGPDSSCVNRSVKRGEDLLRSRSNPEFAAAVRHLSGLLPE